MPTMVVAAVTSSATALSISSRSRGMKASTAAPTMGRKTATVSMWFEIPSGSRKKHQTDCEHCRGAEQHGRVLLDPPALNVAQDAAALLGRQAGAVDRAVDDALVDHVVDQVGTGLRPLAHPVDDPVDHVLVDPVGGLGHGVLDAAD